MSPHLTTLTTTPQLRAAGLSERRISALVSSGELVRLRRGHYARPEASVEAMRAIRLGGRLTAQNALASHGVWVPPGNDRLHVAVPAHATRLRDPDTGDPWQPRGDVALHWSDDGGRRHRDGYRVDIPTALRHLPPLPNHALIAVLDSALHQGLVTRRELSDTLSYWSPRTRRQLARVDSRSESGVESVARVRLEDAGYSVEAQVVIDERYRVDLLVDRRLVVEVDGRAFHDGHEMFERDRHRDLELVRLGLPVLRLSYRQTMFEWESCESAVAAVLS
jgi:very-short-patch-repair endonuclease